MFFIPNIAIGRLIISVKDILNNRQKVSGESHRKNLILSNIY